MSTKTTFKRIALVTVAALGFGVMSVVPSNAATQADTLTLSAATATMQTGETSTATTVSTSALFANAGDTITVTAFLSKAPAANTAVPTLTLAETTSAVVTTTAAESVAGTPVVAVGGVIGQTAYVVNSAASAAYAAAKFNVLIASAADATVAGVKAGTYEITFAVTVAGGGGVKNSTNQVLTVTVTTNPALDTVASSVTSYILGLTDTTTAEDAVLTASKAVNTDLTPKIAAHIIVTQKNAAGQASNESITVTVTGPGILGQQPLDAATTNYVASGRAISLKNGNVIDVFSDGSSGVSTITLTSAAGKELAKETITFYGSATKITATVLKSVIGVGAGTNSVLLSATDASGTQVSDFGTGAFYVTSDKTTSIAGARTQTTVAAYSATNGTTINSPGYIVNLSAQAIAAGTASLTFGTCSAAPTATSTCVDTSNAVSIRVGSVTPASVEVTTDKATYVPGEKATISVVLKDKDGLVLADGDYANIFDADGIYASYSLGNGSDATDTHTVGLFAKGVKKYSVYMPVAEGTVDFDWTTGTNLAVANAGKVGKTITVAVQSNSGAAAAAAAEEATAAANDATDAALSAAEAAEAATAMAQEAVDAVAELSASVTKLISALRAQITTLTNLVVKIQKKVKA
jgi:hypothetical protein